MTISKRAMKESLVNSSMEFLLLYNLLFFFLLFSSLSIPTKGDEYFINCGSSSNTTADDGRTFAGDTAKPPPTGVKLLAKLSSVAKDAGNQSELLYQTAVIFNSPAVYRFTISQSGTYILRLHFYAFSSSVALARSRFQVSASGHLLLPNFSGKASLNTRVLKEFLITVSAGEFNVYFIPGSSSAVAFVNAIELFSAHLNAMGGKSHPFVVSSGLHVNLVSSVLTPVHRINVGGQEVSPANDKLWRKWLPDDRYLLTKNAVKDFPARSSRPDYQGGNATEYDAPDAVYNTAKELNVNSSGNATWSFNVSRSSTYFVRVHFCDIVSEALGAIVFNLFIYKDFAWRIDPYAAFPDMAAPFYLDFLVTSDDLGFMNVSIGPRDDTRITKSAFLNGLEIMEVISDSVVEPDVSAADGGKKKVGLIAGVVAGVIGLICVIAACFYINWKCKRTKKIEAKPEESVFWPLTALSGLNSNGKLTGMTASNGFSVPGLHLKLRMSFAEIQQMTNNFEEGLVVGEGGFGKVYMGFRKNGTKVAVKRSDSKHGQGFTEFLAEVTVLSKIRHRHLVQLIGYCDENNEMVLVYEFMERGTLRDHLYNSIENNEGLSWKQRLEICIGAAKGLHYLHTGSIGGGIIHRDVKSTNILLDENYVAKVADFGLSRSGPPDQQDYVSTNVKGTFGYLDPEYYQCLQLTEKSDVYSFGVVLLEVLCARQVINRNLPKEEVNLVDWAMDCKERGQAEMIMDPLLLGKVNPNSLKKFLETAEKCLRENGSDRPPMSDVLWDLEYALQLHKHGGEQDQLSSSTSTTDVSINMPLAIPSFTTNSFPFSIPEDGISMSGSTAHHTATGE